MIKIDVASGHKTMIRGLPMKYMTFILLLFFSLNVSGDNPEKGKDDYQNAQLNLDTMYDDGGGVLKDPLEDPEAFKWNEKLAEQGDADAQYILAIMYIKGKGVQQDYKEAFKWFMKSAVQGDADAQYNLAVVYATGKGVEEDQREAFKWYKKAAEQGYANAQNDLAVVYATGKGVQQDRKEAFKWYKKSAEQGNADAQFNLGTMYSKGQGVLEDKKEALKWMKKSAIQGEPKAQFSLALMYSKGRGVQQDKKEAFKWYKESAEQGYALAQYNLSSFYSKGLGVQQDKREAFKWVKKAAEHGNSSGQSMLGTMYSLGQGVQQDHKESVKWFKKSAEQGDASAQLIVGSMYHRGKGVQKDYKEAFKWYKKSAEQGDAVAQYAVASSYYSGNGVLKDRTEAFKWYKRSAEQGHAQAQYELVVMYCNGKGTLKNLNKCSYWAKKADENGEDVKELWEKFELWKHKKESKGEEASKLDTVLVGDIGSFTEFTGNFDEGDGQKIIQTMKDNGTKLLALNSAGGLVLEAQMVGYFLRSHNINTMVKNVCASACVFAFAGGTQRTILKQAKIGIHQSSLAKEEGSLADGQAITGKYLRYFKHMGIDSEVVAIAANTSSDSMYWLTSKEMLQLNLITSKHVIELQGDEFDSKQLSKDASSDSNQKKSFNLQEAAQYFEDYYWAKTQGIYDYCESKGVDISMYISTYKDVEADAYDRATETLNRNGYTFGRIYKDNSDMFLQKAEKMIGVFRISFAKLLSSESITSTQVCQIFANFNDRKILEQFSFANENPDIYKVLME